MRCSALNVIAMIFMARAFVYVFRGGYKPWESSSEAVAPLVLVGIGAILFAQARILEKLGGDEDDAD